MKRCPECRRDYVDDTLLYCLEDGAALVQGSVASPDEPRTAILHDTGTQREAATRAQIYTTDQTAVLPSAAAELSRSKTFDRRLLMVPLVVAVVVLGGFFTSRYLNFAGKAQINSIAVLPLQNNSSSTDSEYLSDGLAESLIYRLSQLPDLKVSSASSVMRYKGQTIDPRKIAAELGVQAILTGRLAQRGDNLSISVELIDAATNNTLWGEQYDRKMSDLLATQREIAATIADKLKVKLTGGESKGVTKRYTDNNEAYQEYLRGRHYWNKRTKDALERAIVHFQKAIDLDPQFALAHAGIADAYYVMPSYAYMATKEAMPRAIASSRRALDIDPELAEAHAIYGSALTYEFRWAEAEAELKRSVELDPNSAQSHYRYAIEYLAPVGRLDDAFVEGKRAVELEPLSLPIGANLAGLYIYSRKYDLALEHALKVYALEPGHATASYWLGWAYIANGRYQEAIDLCNKVLPSQPDNQDLLQILGFAHAKAGRPAETMRILAKFAEMEKNLQYVVAYRVATLNAVLGNKDKAFAELEKSYEARDWDFNRLKVDPFIDAVRDDTRFQPLLRKLNLPE